MHSPLSVLLQNYNPSDQWEQVCKRRMLEFIQLYPNCFERSLEIGHFTGSAWLLNHNKTQVLLMHHTKLNKWLQLGGHCDGNPDVLAVAIKEAQEESGIQNIAPISTDIFDIDIHALPATAHNKEHLHYDVRFLLQVIGDEAIIQNSESQALQWFGKDQTKLPTRSPSIIRMFNKWSIL